MASLLAVGCASVPMESADKDARLKLFEPPQASEAGLYIFRDSSRGASLKKTIYVNGSIIGESAPNTYFYQTVPPGKNTISTESEFGENDLEITTEGGKNYFVRQYIRFGVFVGGANLELTTEEEGREGVLECELAQIRTVLD
ncbi:MAG: DUF2846 domain-containing protein [Rhodocyclaceae bacterium]|nr:DUF2846 domain-containing protein [Rhodocyclaceae bacterium]